MTSPSPNAEPPPPSPGPAGALAARRRPLAWIALAGYTLFLSAALLTPDPKQTISKVTGVSMERVVPRSVKDYHEHFAAYLLLGALATWALNGRAGWAWLAASGHGVLTELLQGLVPPRTPSLSDAVADLLGALVGCLVVGAVMRWRQTKIDIP